MEAALSADNQKEAAGLCVLKPVSFVHFSSTDPRTSRINDYFRVNSRPVNLDGLLQLLTPDVIVDYPSGRFFGLDSYMAHQVLPLRPPSIKCQTAAFMTLMQASS